MPNEKEKSNHQINNERIIELLNELEFDSATYLDGTTTDEWQKHPELFADDDDVEVEVNKDSRFLK